MLVLVVGGEGGGGAVVLLGVVWVGTVLVVLVVVG